MPRTLPTLEDVLMDCEIRLRLGGSTAKFALAMQKTIKNLDQMAKKQPTNGPAAQALDDILEAFAG